jgi:hypothetical protein
LSARWSALPIERVCECACPVGMTATSNATAHAQRVAYVENME